MKISTAVWNSMSLSRCAMNTIYPGSKINRFHVPDDKANWNVDFVEYLPSLYEAHILKSASWADPSIEKGSFQWHQLDGSVDRRSFEGNYSLDANGYPLNPKGRTGIRGRGLLGHWGPNHCADPIVTRWKRDHLGNQILDGQTNKPILQLVTIQRKDCGLWALPGGIIDPNEKALTAAMREFMEEATDSLTKSNELVVAVREKLKTFFNNGDPIYKGYVGDPRNTDNAWLETSAFSFHDDTGDIIGNIELKAGDDAANVKWIDLSNEIRLYATHKDFVHKVAIKKDCHW